VSTIDHPSSGEKEHCVECGSHMSEIPKEKPCLRNRVPPCPALSWRAADSGTQTIRLVFDVPQRIRRIWPVVEETEAERSQKFVLRWFSDGGHSFREIVRQQWNFSPPETTREDHQVELSDVTVLAAERRLGHRSSVCAWIESSGIRYICKKRRSRNA